MKFKFIFLRVFTALVMAAPLSVFAADSCDGVNVVTDPAGDATNPAPGGQGPTSQADITAVSFSSSATTLTTIITIANLTRTPSPGTTFTSYYVVWTSSNGTKYATEVDVDSGTISYFWGPWNSSNNRLSALNSVTGTFNAGVNGTITVPVPRSGIGNPTIPITDPSGTTAVTDPFAYTIAGEGVLGSGLVFTAFMDRAPNTGSGSRAFVCDPPPPDADGDGVPDTGDLCPSTPAGATVDATGCPVSGGAAACTVPGIRMITDPKGDHGGGNAAYDLLAVSIAEVPSAQFERQMVFTMEIDDLSTLPPQARWFVTLKTPSGGDYFVGMTNFTDENGGQPVLRYGSGLQASPFQEIGRGAAGSGFTRDGVITIVVPTAALAIPAGGTVTNIEARVYQSAGSGSAAFAFGALNDSGSAAESYVMAAAELCGDRLPQPPAPASGLAPRYQIHASPPGLSDDSGEPSVGYNKHTKHTMFIALTQALRQTYQENVVPQVLPASCDATWEDKSGNITTANTLDPILFTDEATGRTFNSQLSGANSLFEFTDNDGETWTPGQVGAPNGGADHQTVASGPYPAGQTPPNALWPATGPKRAVYYCSQSVSNAFCSRSDDGGQTFGPGFPFKNLDCGVGALHGHVKVAPDGTVYVPDSSQCITELGTSAGHVIAFASADAGKTWSVRDIPQSTGGAASDPSIGIATDGTAYMCYENADSTVHVAVSHDKGQTWENDQDIGAALGIVQTRFPQMIAGDPDRAACDFLGTTTPGNGASLDFRGVWHGYVATTYDGGASWHLVNVTPGDPVQGHGGVGPSGTNRNLLDFNDLQIDDEGRTLFGFADGCIGGCVKDPSANSFAAKGTIIRQTGGRTLFAKFDDVSGLTTAVPRYNATTPIEPAAACARQDLSVRTVAQSKVVWNAPDTGGSPITNYKVYRALDPAEPFTFLGGAGITTEFLDSTADPSVEKYYYKVVAENTAGAALDSNIIELAISVAPVVDTCTLPGDIIVVDSTGDGAGADTDIVYLGVAEPEAYADSFVITEKIADFTADQPPPNSFYPIMFPLKGNLYIALDATQGPPKFTHGTFTVGLLGVLTFTERGRLPGSSFAANGTIILIVPRTLFGDPAVGGVISGFDARARVGGQSATSRDTAGPGDYTVRGTAICVVPEPEPFALGALSASTNHGKAPLDVTFTLSGTPAKGKRLDSYSILFGDEQGASPPPFTGSFAGLDSVQLTHTYLEGGNYPARLIVTDTGGNTSTNLAEETLQVLAADLLVPPGDAPEYNNRLGGSLSTLSLLALSLLGSLGLWRRRRKLAAG